MQEEQPSSLPQVALACQHYQKSFFSQLLHFGAIANISKVSDNRWVKDRQEWEIAGKDLLSSPVHNLKCPVKSRSTTTNR
jgi:hypothetical protein